MKPGTRLTLLARTCACLMLLTASASLAWYGAWTNRVAARDREFAGRRLCGAAFPETLVWRGNEFFYTDMDADAAISHYRKALAGQPLFMDAWMALAQAELIMGRREEARRILSLATAPLAQVSYWKWKELLLAFDLGEEENFERCFNFILGRTPWRAPDACELAARFWGGRANVIGHTAPDNYCTLMEDFIESGSPEEALSLWDAMKAPHKNREGDERACFPDNKLISRLCDFFLSRSMIEPAVRVWKEWPGSGDFPIHDGEFESEPVNGGFGWRLGRHSEVTVERSSRNAHKGRYALHLRFRGAENVKFDQVSQLAPVLPGGRYCLGFARRSRNITTDQGVFVRVSGYACGGDWQVAGRPVAGSTPWEAETLEIEVPGDCRIIRIQVCRTKSRKLDNKIIGDYWLDSVELLENCTGSRE